MHQNGKRLVLLGLLLVGAGSLGAQSDRVLIHYRLERLARIASNQVAVWIEDEAGRYIRTVFVTDFTGAREGFRRRSQALAMWVKASGVAGWSRDRIDAVSGATQRPGEVNLTWDCTDDHGRRVAGGTYVYHVEGNIFWENSVLWTGDIRVGGQPDTSRALPEYIPERAAQMGRLLSDVTATYQP